MSYFPVSIQACANYEESTVRQSLGLVLRQMDALNFVRPGMTVAIKVNLVAAARPEEAATTHPALVRELCRLITEKGARPVMGDSPGGLFSSMYLKGIYQATGLHAVEDVGGTLNDNFEVRDAVDHDAAVLHTFPYTAWLEEADAIICFSKLKTHAMMGMTCSVKNMFGTIPGTAKSECHMRFSQEDRFADMLIDLNEHFRPALYLVDAVEGMEGNGPTAGHPRHIGCVLASRSPYSLDAVCAGIINLSADRVPTLRRAAARGLGPENGDDVTILGDSPNLFRVADFDTSAAHRDLTFSSPGLVGRVTGSVMKMTMTTRPGVRKGLCIGCGKCSQVCPAHAITMEDRLPRIARDRCIRCFCCQEFCPKGAMQVQRTLPGRIVHGISVRGKS